MFPTLAQIGPLVITSLGFFLAVAFLVGLFFVWKKGKEENFDLEPLMDVVFLSLVAAFLGARTLFVIFSPARSLAMAFNFSRYPGFSYFGALIGGVLFLRYFTHRLRWDFYKLADVLVFGLVPAQALARIGNFLDGSFYGRVTGLPWGIKFPGLESRVHPLALYEIFFLVGLYFIIAKLERQYRLFDWYRDKRGEAAPGFLFLTYLLAYSVFRFLLEFAKDSSLYWYGLAWEQVLSLWLVVATLVLFYKRSGRRLREIFAPLAKKWQKIVTERKRQELKVIVPLSKKRKRVGGKQPFHFKAGMEAKKE